MSSWKKKNEEYHVLLFRPKEKKYSRSKNYYFNFFFLPPLSHFKKIYRDISKRLNNFYNVSAAIVAETTNSGATGFALM